MELMDHFSGCPYLPLSNWYNEIRKFAPKIKVTKYIGTKQERNDIDLLQQQETTNIILTLMKSQFVILINL